MDPTTLGTERAEQPVPARARAPVSRRSRRRAARTTCCLPSRTSAPASSRPRRRSSSAPATAASRRRRSRPRSCSAARWGRRPTSSRRRCTRFQDASGDSLTLRPEGTAPVVRSYLEHGMHKEPQPVKLWYLSSFFRYERPQAGRFRQFWQIGAEAIGSADPAVDAELILLLGELLEAIGARDVQARAGQPRPAGEPRGLPRGADRLPARATRTSSAARWSSGSTSTRCARSTPSTSPPSA